MLLLPRLWRPRARICYCSGWCSKSDPTNDHLCELTFPGTRQTTDGKVTGTQFTVACITHHESIPKRDALGTQAFRVKNTHNVVLTPSVQIQSVWVWSLPSCLPALDPISDHSQVPCWLFHFTYSFPKASVFGMFGQDRRHCFPIMIDNINN